MQLMAVARYGAVEALAVQGLSSDQAIALEQAVREAGGALLTSANLERAVVLAPLSVAGELPSRLSATEPPMWAWQSAQPLWDGAFRRR